MSEKKASVSTPAQSSKKAHRRVKHKPALGSWDAAIAANSAEAGAGALGTNVAYLYNECGRTLICRRREDTSRFPPPDTARTSPTYVTGDEKWVWGLTGCQVDVHGKGDFATPQEEDVDYWNEDEAREPRKSVRSAERKVAVASKKEEDSAPQEQEQQAAAGEVEEDKYLDEKPALGSWEMAKFANNVEAGGGSLGTNVAYMYDSLSNKGHYKEVAAESETCETGNMATAVMSSTPGRSTSLPSSSSWRREGPRYRRHVLLLVLSSDFLDSKR
eukprot:753651-Hanusia_phi.AAC.5